MKNADDMIKELEAQVSEEEQVEEKSESEELVEAAEEEVVEEETEEETEEESDEGEEEPEEDHLDTDEDDADVPPKEKKAWVKMRHKNKALKEASEKQATELQEMRERMAKMEGVQSVQPATAPVVAAEPDREFEPEAWQDWNTKELESKIATLTSNQEQITQNQNAHNALRGVQILENQYKQASPDSDYDGALDFVRAGEKNRIKLNHPTATDQQIEQHLDKAKMDLFTNLYNQGLNPAEAIVKFAKDSGYEVAAKEAPKKKMNTKNLKKNMKKSASLVGNSSSKLDYDATPDQVFGASMDDLLTSGSIDEAIKNSIENSSD